MFGTRPLPIQALAASACTFSFEHKPCIVDTAPVRCARDYWVKWRVFVKTQSIRVAAVALTLLLASNAHATNFCVSFGDTQIVANGLILQVKGKYYTFKQLNFHL
jgi:hypothetical protein